MGEQFWSVRVYGFEGCPYDPVVARPTIGAARYAAFSAMREAGYFTGSDGFLRFLVNVRARLATASEVQFAPRLSPSPLTPKIEESAR
jgi:hypothetical protein